jgi:hypothetical protein
MGIGSKWFAAVNILVSGYFLSSCGLSSPISSGEAGIAGNLLTPPSSVLLALKFVEFLPSQGAQRLGEAKVKKLVEEMNSIYSKCSISFRLEETATVNPDQFGLPYHLNSVEKMHEVRKPFDDPRYLVVISTGSWDHKKMGAANAWTAMPGEIPSGAVVESPVVTFAGIVAHEIGHYLSLNHVKNNVNLMNPIIYQVSKELTAEQCANMRATAATVRGAAIRQPTARQEVGGKPTANLRAEYSG